MKHGGEAKNCDCVFFIRMEWNIGWRGGRNPPSSPSWPAMDTRSTNERGICQNIQRFGIIGHWRILQVHEDGHWPFPRTAINHWSRFAKTRNIHAEINISQGKTGSLSEIFSDWRDIPVLGILVSDFSKSNFIHCRGCRWCNLPKNEPEKSQHAFFPGWVVETRKGVSRKMELSPLRRGYRRETCSNARMQSGLTVP